MVRMTGLSGNEIYCLSLKGYTRRELRFLDGLFRWLVGIRQLIYRGGGC